MGGKGEHAMGDKGRRLGGEGRRCGAQALSTGAGVLGVALGPLLFSAVLAASHSYTPVSSSSALTFS
eukprot:3208942-Rhodomonas_salina.2